MNQRNDAIYWLGTFPIKIHCKTIQLPTSRILLN